jgi:glutamine amidotransferase
VGLINYGSGNIYSVNNAFTHLGVECRLVSSPLELSGISHLVLPGVGAFAHCFAKLVSSGFVDPLNKWAIDECRPFLGICVGMQLLADYGEEIGGSMGLGFIPGVVELIPKHEGLRIPHVGWNGVSFIKGKGANYEGLNGEFYFDHSYYFKTKNPKDILATVNHGRDFVAAVKHENIVGVQFHPEKSQTKGLMLLKSFLGI